MRQRKVNKMKYIKKITADEINEALGKFYEVASYDDFFQVKGFYAQDEDLCFASKDDNCFYCFELRNSVFVYFALDQGKFSNIRGMWEAMYEIICSGFPFIRLCGRAGRYSKLLKAFSNWQRVDQLFNVKGHEDIVWYAGHPENVKKILKRTGEINE